MKYMKECGICKKNPELCGLTDDDYIDPEEVLFSDEFDDETDDDIPIPDNEFIDEFDDEDIDDVDIDESCGKKKSKKKTKWLPFKEYVKQKQQVKEALKVIEDAGFVAEKAEPMQEGWFSYRFTKPNKDRKYIKILKTLFDCGGYLKPAFLKKECGIKEGTDQMLFSHMAKRFFIKYDAKRNLWFIMPDGLRLLQKVYPNLDTDTLMNISSFRSKANKYFDKRSKFGNGDTASDDELDTIARMQGIEPSDDVDEDDIYYGTEPDGDERNDDTFYDLDD